MSEVGKAGKPTWDVSDYTGKYHVSKIAASLAPIPGTQLSRENARLHEAKERWERPKRMRMAAEARTKLQLDKKETVRADVEKIRSTYGWQANAVASSAMVSEIDVATKKFAARQEPSLFQAGETLRAALVGSESKNLTKQQRQLVAAVLDQNYREVHRIFLEDEGISSVSCDFSVGKHHTPLILATRMGNTRMVSILLREGKADANYPNAIGLPPLFYVFEEWRDQVLHKVPGRDSLVKMLDRAKDIIQELGNARANVNAIDHLGSTPVHLAAGMGHARHLFLMCKFGFDPTIRNNCGQLAVDVARSQDKIECVIVLTEWPRIRRTVELELFREGWKPFLQGHSSPSRHSMHVSQTADEIMSELALKDRRRRNEKMERELAFGTGVRFVRDDDDVLRRGNGADMDEMTATTEVIMASMRRALLTGGLDTKKKSEKDIQDARQKLQQLQALSRKRGGTSKRKRREMKRRRAEAAKADREKMPMLAKRRLRVTAMLLAGAHSGSPQKLQALRNRSMGKRETLADELRRTSASTQDADMDLDDDDEPDGSQQSNRERLGMPEPLRPATKSALFRPRFISPSKMSRNSRSSLLPLGLNVKDTRKALRSGSYMLPSEKLVLEERKTPAEILAEKLEQKLKDGSGSKQNMKSKGSGDGKSVAAAIVPANLLPPPPKAIVGDGDDAGKDKFNDNSTAGDGVISSVMLNADKKKSKIPRAYRRSKFTGFSPGFTPMTEPWTQTEFTMELPSSSKNLTTMGTYQF